MRTIETALEVVRLADSGRFDELAALFTPEMRAVVSPETVRVAWSVQTSGKPCTPGTPFSEPVDEEPRTPTIEPAGKEPRTPSKNLVRVRVPVRCAAGDFETVMSLDPAGRLHGLRLAPAPAAWQPPRYAKPRRFTEVETGHGTLTRPAGKGPHPAAVLLPGGGEQDRDGSHGPNRPLKDIAWGLASRGVAVFRFDKPAPGSTLTEEYVTPALDVVREMREQRSTVDPDRIFLIGHSLGGKVAPRVAAAEPAVAGLVLLAAEAMPTQRSAQRVARHLAARDPGPASDAMVAAIDRQVARVDDGLTPETPAAELPFGFPASYWLDLRDYDPVATAAGLDRPMLILQGGRDHQVTVAEDLARWRAGLGGRKDVKFRVLQDCDHLFHRGAGPADHQLPQHVDGAVIRQIARWLRRPRR